MKKIFITLSLLVLVMIGGVAGVQAAENRLKPTLQVKEEKMPRALAGFKIYELESITDEEAARIAAGPEFCRQLRKERRHMIQMVTRERRHP